MIVDKQLQRQQQQATDAESTVESYKVRSKSYFRNPLSPPRDALVNVPDNLKPAIYRQPLYQIQTDLIANGIGENQRGVPRPSDKETLIGHQSVDQKHHMLTNFTKDNLQDLTRKMD